MLLGVINFYAGFMLMGESYKAWLSAEKRKEHYV
jgi:hypothetical protein